MSFSLGDDFGAALDQYLTRSDEDYYIDPIDEDMLEQAAQEQADESEADAVERIWEEIRK